MAKTKSKKKAAKPASIDEITILDAYGHPETVVDFYEGASRLGRSCLAWREAWQYLSHGVPVKRVPWMGYWAMENDKLVMHCKDGSLVTLDKCDERFTLDNIAQTDWVPLTQGMKDNLDAVHKALCLEYKKGK
jgi:hypothetical protein